MMLSQLRLSLGLDLETMGLGLGLVAMGLSLGLECVGLVSMLQDQDLEALSLESKYEMVLLLFQSLTQFPISIPQQLWPCP